MATPPSAKNAPPTCKDVLKSLEQAHLGLNLVLDQESATVDKFIEGFDFSTAEKHLIYARQSIRRLQNASAPVLHLPPEIFGRILTMVQYSLIEERSGIASFSLETTRIPWRYLYKWLRYTHICHYWRALAISCPYLWTAFDIRCSKTCAPGGSGHVETFLRNSGRLPLSARIVTEASSHVSRSTLRALQEMERFDELSVISVGKVVPQTILDTLKEKPATNLRRLTLRPPLDTVQFPALFRKPLPHLESLSFSEYTDLKHLTFHGLKQLHMSRQDYRSPKTFYAMLDFLQGLPMLEDLMFSETKFSHLEFGKPERIHSPISLDKLRRCAFIDMSLRFAAYIFREVNIKTDHELALTFEIDHYGTPDAEFLVSHCPWVFQNAGTSSQIELGGRSTFCSLTLQGDTQAVCFKCPLEQWGMCRVTFSTQVIFKFQPILSLYDVKKLWIVRRPEMVRKSRKSESGFSWAEDEDDESDSLCSPVESEDQSSAVGTSKIFEFAATVTDLYMDLPFCDLEVALAQLSKDPRTCRGLRGLYVTISPKKSWDAFDALKRTVVQRARCKGTTMVKQVHIFCSYEGHYGNLLLKDWPKEIYAELGPHSKCDLYVHGREEFPVMELPPVCRIPSSERWEWPVWKDRYDSDEA